MCLCPRSRYTKAKVREEFNRPCAYVLSGRSDDSGVPRIYVGEGESIRPRLDSHFANKDFWTTATFFVSKDENLNKVLVQHLESRLVQLAQEANRCEIDNANVPSPPALSEADRAEAEGFLDEVLLCLPVVGLNMFESPAAPESESARLALHGKGTEATGYESPDGFVVTAGSRARPEEVASIHRYLLDLRCTLLERGILAREDTGLRLAQDYEFSSPSTAAGVMLGRSANGRIEWKDAEGRTLKELQEASTVDS